ncbi:hypothetical protein pEaSNUABM34_00031 [Erwinia phage pEa_SNUABM_34]|uniref:Uncharacterized protein n=1 Tax=Erwinia phage pEa_SNUABM_7 TaxID=2866695 RepID=A0AAE7WSN6_9CAUD|nr:hypothetical protein MPK74_gp031 [Erwinia phage pEa_SNUABM_7]QYW03333.1 hypothetical protein pEaSNUABM34_00031 [Erwinia phage pEa_SNUABM_34]QYW04699.1 hypothetical protein pEaSNUABM7_00031 [Erwinia phage pEa_SNUABM_7]
MEAPEGTNLKLWSIAKRMDRVLEHVAREAWFVSGDPKDTCGAVAWAGNFDDESLIAHIEMRAAQIEERRRYTTRIRQGSTAYTVALENHADAIYAKYGRT